MSEPKVTIVIPTFNRAILLANAINSALSQSEKCNIIVVDHGSTDNTEDVVKRFGPRIEYVHLENDFGPIFSWVHGILSAKTEFVKILYDDDLLAPTFVSEALALMTSKVGFVASNASVMDLESGELIKDSLFSIFNKTGVFRCSGFRGVIVARLMISPSALLFRRKDLLDGLYLGSLPYSKVQHHGAGPDHYVKLLAMLRYQHFGIIERPLVSFGAHQGSITVQASKDEIQRGILRSVYDEVWIYYLQLKLLKVFRFAFNPISLFVRYSENFFIRIRR